MKTAGNGPEKHHLLSDDEESNVGDVLPNRFHLRRISSPQSVLALFCHMLCALSIVLNVLLWVRNKHEEGSKWGT